MRAAAWPRLCKKPLSAAADVWDEALGEHVHDTVPKNRGQNVTILGVLSRQP